MKFNKSFGALSAASLLMPLMPISANAELTEAADRMCEKIKQCSFQAVDDQGLPPEMKEMITAMMDEQCATMTQNYRVKSVEEAGLADQAEKCVDSIVAISCKEMMESQGSFETPACKEYEAAADKAGIKLDQTIQTGSGKN